MGQVGQKGVVVGGLVANAQAAGLVVSGHQDQGIIGMLGVELHSGLHRVVHLDHIMDGGSGIVGVAGPVDLAGLHHHKEAVAVVQQLNALADIVGQLPLSRSGIHGVVHGLAVGQILGNDQGLACPGLQGSSTGLGGDNVVTGLCSHLVVVGAGAIAVHLLELAACEILKSGVCQLHTDLIVVLAGLLVCIEGSRGGVVNIHRGNNANLVALLLMELLRNGLIGHITGPRAHIDDTALGLFAGSDGGSGGSGVRAEGGAVVGGHTAHFRELGKAQLCLGDGTVVGDSALIEPGRLDLGSAHAIADEQEDVLGLILEQAKAVLLVSCGGSSRSGSVCSHRGSSHQTGGRCHSTHFQEVAAGHFMFFHTIIPLLS